MLSTRMSIILRQWVELDQNLLKGNKKTYSLLYQHLVWCLGHGRYPINVKQVSKKANEFEDYQEVKVQKRQAQVLFWELRWKMEAERLRKVSGKKGQNVENKRIFSNIK